MSLFFPSHQPQVLDPKRLCYRSNLLAHIASRPVRFDGSRIFDIGRAAKECGIKRASVGSELKQMLDRRPEQTVSRFEYAGDGDFRVWLTPLGESLAQEVARAPRMT